MMAFVVIGAATMATAADPDNPNRVEKQRADLAGAPGFEVVNSITTYRKGEGVPLHYHNGAESAYVVQGTTIRRQGKPAPELLATGTVLMNARGVIHGGYVIVGDTPLILFSVHAVDKGKPLYVWVK